MIFFDFFLTIPPKRIAPPISIRIITVVYPFFYNKPGLSEPNVGYPEKFSNTDHIHIFNTLRYV